MSGIMIILRVEALTLLPSIIHKTNLPTWLTELSYPVLLIMYYGLSPYSWRFRDIGAIHTDRRLIQISMGIVIGRLSLIGPGNLLPEDVKEK